MKITKYLILVISLVGAVSCADFMAPEPDASIRPEYTLESKDYFQGILYAAYRGLPTRIQLNYEAATDNAVTNNQGTASSRFARGGLSAQNNPFGDVWDDNYLQINRINWFIEKMVLDTTKSIPTPVKFNIDAKINLQTYYFLLGEAYFLRAWYYAQLLKQYGGVASDGKVLGVPLSDTYLTYNENLDLARNTYQECTKFITNDCDSAFKYLPLNYSKTTGLITAGLLNDAGHASGIAAKALKARVLLYAASPAYNPDNLPKLWDDAAKAASEAITAIGFEDLMTYTNYFSKNNLNDKNYSNKDIFFRGSIEAGKTTLESENFPPRANGGRGLYNPTQNLVDAFAMADGYPRATSPTIIYDAANLTSTHRDPRLDLFIVRNGETFAKLTIATTTGGLDAIGADQNATRTGYYLQKLLDGTVSLETGKVVTTTRAPILLNRAELYLNFAEAAIQVAGNPTTAVYGFSPREVLAKVRTRAFGGGKDKYLNTVTDKATFEAMVKNERRVELCFEDHRFWDMRRWVSGATDISVINSPVYGIYSNSILETRYFKSPFMPLPYSEILKTKNLLNNAGW